MFRFININAWLRAVFRYITAWIQAAAAAGDPDAAFPQGTAAADDSYAASLQGTAAMDFPVTVSLGPLHRPLHSFRATKNDLPDGVSEGEVQRLEEDLEALFTELKVVSEADDPSFTARCWMKEVRELRYDAEDFFDEVPRPCAGAGRSVLLAIILWIPSKLKRRRQAAEAFSDLLARAMDASRRRQSFQIGPATVKPEFWQANVSCSKRQPCLQLIGLEESMDKLVKLMALDDQEIADLLAFDSEGTEEQIQVVPIFGSAGVGKTTLARTFYGIFGGKFQCRAFVRVSRNPDMRRMLSSMLSQIKAPLVRGFPDVQDLIDHIREYLRFKRYLIVIDDLWASSTWDIISRAFPDGDCCSRIIVTTEIEDVALACSRYEFKYMYEMSPLNDHQSRNLFLSRVFGSENGCPPDFKEVTYEIIRKCGGLPLAIENIASMLSCELDVDQWKHVQDSLPSILGLRTSPGSEGLKEVLNIIYNNLSPYLKTCLLYLIMYPEGNTISKEDLVKQWVAEDLIGEGQDREKTARGYFDELVSRGMIQPVDRNYNDEVLTCTVHHMVLDLIRYKSLEENFIINVSCFQTTPGLPDKVRRLSVQFGGAKCANMPADFMMTQVRSLIFFGFLNCVPSFVEYKVLRVLILHIWADGSKIFDLTRIGELFQLRCLKIDCNITVHLPDEIRQLKFLETLELHAPVNDMPSDISCLPLLRTLGYFDLSKNSLENVGSLGELNNLQDLHLTWSNIAEPDNLKNNMQCLRSILWKLSNLKSLTLVPAASSDAGVLDNAAGASVGISGDILSSMSSPPALLQRLELSGRCCIFSSLPEWTKELGNLCILKISVRKLLKKDIDILKGLPALMALSLYIWTAPVGKVVFDNEGFSVLKYFKFTCAAPCAAFLKGAMPSVRELKLAFNANRMEQYPQIVPGLEYLIELREIAAEVGGTGADESDRRYAESALSGAIANHPCTPIIRVECVDQILFGAVTQEQEYWTLEEQHEIQEELLDPLPEFLISTPSTQTQMRYGEQDEGRDRSVEVLTQEQEHWTLDPVPELLSTPSTPTQTRDGVQGEQMERSKEQEQEHRITEKQHEVQVELLDPLADLPISTPSTQTQTRDGEQNGGTERSREVLTQEQQHMTLVKQHKIQEELLDPLPELLSTSSTQTQTRDGVKGEQIEGSMEVLTHEHGHLTLEEQHEIQVELLDQAPSTPSRQTQARNQVQDGEMERSMEVLTQEQEECTLEKQHEMADGVQDVQIVYPEFLISTPSTQTQMRYGEQDEGRDRSVEVLTQEQEHWTLDPVPELLSTPSTPTQTRDGVQGEQMERSKEQEQEHRITEKQHEVQMELLDPLADLPISTPSTQTQTRDGGQNGGTERSREVLTQEQQHMTLVKQHKIQEELLDPLPELLSTSSTQTQTRDGVKGEQIEGSMEVLTHEHGHLTLEEQHEIQVELLDQAPSTPSRQTQARNQVQDGEMERSVEVLTQEQEECTLEKQHEMADGVQDVQIGRLMEVVAQEEHNTLQKQHEIEKKLLDPPPELLSIPCTPSTQTQPINRRLNGGIGELMEVVSASHGTLGPLLRKLTGLLASEHAGLKWVRHEVRFLRSELKSMHAGMRKYTMLEDPDVQVKDWISLVRELSYDTEDCIDKFFHQLGNDSRHSGFKQFFRKTARQLKTLGSRHGIAEKIDDLKTCIKELKELKNSFKLDDIACITSYQSTVDPRLSALFVDDADLVGIEGPREDLAKWMVETGNNSAKHHLRVLSIVGFGGLGKTTLANDVYRKAKGHFHCQAFVSVSQKPDIKRIIKDLIFQVSSHGFREDIGNWDEMRSIEKLRELLQDKRYLVVIDDIWSIEAWKVIKCVLPENNCSSIIITTTRIIEVARSCCMGHDDCMYRMQPLSDFHSKKLFFRRNFGSEDGPNMLKEVSNEILKKCGGLPLAIINMSSLLANRPANKEEWEKVMGSTGAASLEGMKSILWLSYMDLPDKLKTCLLYLSNFPEGYVIERDRLVRRWIAEGIIGEVHGMSQQEVAENCFYELINRSLIQAVDICYDGKVRACRVHAMMLELIISKSAEDNFVSVIGSGQTGLVNHHGSIRRLSVQHIDKDLASILKNKDLSHVRSLTVTSPSCIEHLPSLGSFENLRVLDFEGCDGLEKYDMKGLDKFFQLKYLSLRGTWISHLPSEIVLLHSLETLDIRETHVEELPAGIVELTMLEHLIASADYARRGIKIPNGIGNMRNLRVLLGCGIGSGSARALGELGNLINLNELDVEYREIGSEYKIHEEMFLSSLCKLGTFKLQSFRIRRRCPGLIEFLEPWSPPPCSLERFEMSGCCSFRCIPGWISPALPNLVYLEINVLEVTEKDLHILGEMPALLHLGLTCQAFRKERLTFHGTGFPCLKEFVYDAAVLPSGNLLFEEGALPKLKDLGLVYCVSMVNAHGFCLGIQHLPQLKNLRVRLYKEGATSSAITSAEVAIRNEADAHPNHPTVTLIEHVKRVDYCSEECPNRTVTELL